MTIQSPLRGQIRNPELREIIREKDLLCLTLFPLAADNDWFDTSQVLAADTAGTYVLTVLAAGMTNATCPGYPVVPVIVVAEDSTNTWTGVSVVVLGVNQFGDTVSETLAATNSSGTWTATASHAYLSLVSVVTTVTGTTSSADTQIIGFAKTIGLTRRIRASGDVIAKSFNGAADAGTISAVNHTYVIAGTPDAAKVLTLCIRSTAY